MSDQNPDMGSFDGLSDFPPSGGGKLFGVDFNAPPSEVLGLDFRPHLDRHLDESPAFGLDYHWHQLNNADQESKNQQKRLIDQGSLDYIERDQQENQKHMDFLSQRIAEIDKNLALPIPLRHMAQVDLGSDIGIGLAALMGAKIPDVIAAGQQNAQRSQDITDQNAQAQYETKRQDLLRQLQSLDQEARGTESYGQRLEEAKIGEVSDREKRNQTEIEKARDRFSKATNPGEVQAAADDLAAAGHPISPQAINDAKQAASLRAQEEVRKSLVSEVQAYERPGLSDASIAELQARADAITAQVPGYPRHVVTGSIPWKAQLETDKQKFQTDKQDFYEKEAREKLRITSAKAAHQYALWKAEEAFYSARPDMAAADRQERLEAAGMRIGEATDKEVRKAQVTLDRKSAELSSINGQIASATGHEKRSLIAKRDGLQRDVAAAKSEVEDWTKVAGSAGIDKSGGAGAMTGGGPSQPKVGDIVQVPGHTGNWQVGADGLLHRVKS